MPRPLSKIAPDWWDYTTLDPHLLRDAAALTPAQLLGLSRPGFSIRVYDTLEEFYCAEALEYIAAWKQSTAAKPVGICGPIGPTEQLPLVARMVDAMEFDLRHAHFWGMDEWVGADGLPVAGDHPLSFARADRALCFDRIDPKRRMPDAHLRFPTGDLAAYSASYDQIRCAVMQGRQGEVKHWAFNDPPRRLGAFVDAPPTPAQYRALPARVVDLHPMTVIQNARTSGGGDVSSVPLRAATVGPRETWKADTVSIWHAGVHDNPFGMRLTTLMIAKKLPDAAVPMSLLADHRDVRFSFYRPGIGTCAAEMH